jgi:hypothetical protein
MAGVDIVKAGTEGIEGDGRHALARAMRSEWRLERVAVVLRVEKPMQYVNIENLINIELKYNFVLRMYFWWNDFEELAYDKKRLITSA